MASVALSMITEQKDDYKLVMANINMPDMDSLSFLRVLHKKEIPVIFMSSEMNVNVAKKALAEGACFFLEKPISLEDLKSVWQHVYRKIRTPMKYKHKPNYGTKMNSGKDCQGMKINEAGDVLRPPLGGVKSNGAGGECSLATGHALDIDKQNTSTLTCNAQGASGIKLPIDDKEEQEEVNRDSNGITGDKKPRAVWTPELHLKFTAALSALGDLKSRPKAILKLMNVPNITVRQVASHLQKYKNQVQRIRGTDTTSLPSSLSRLSNCINRNEFPPAKQSSMVCQYDQRTSSFGVRGNTAQLDAPNSLITSPIPVAGFNNHDYRRQNLYSGHTILSHYTNHHTNNPSEFYLRTQGQFQNLNQLRETDSFGYGAGMNEIMNQQPLGIEENRFRTSESHFPSMNYITPEAAASPYISGNTFQVPNEPSVMNQEQYYTSSLTGPFDSQNQNQFSTEGARLTTEVLELVPEQIASGNATNPNKFPADFNDGSQKLDTTAGEASSPNKNQPLSEYDELLKLLEEDPQEASCVGSVPNAGDPDRYCEWLRETLLENSTDPL
ncbi:two-component response regulator ORR24 [Prunus persica]|uniref:two-component response regulator ORR24 n=1 Tax=Prunus persica TaxID=3760 RepID=UPI0009AB5CB9|nr:two-component response regulator ORR24 [Prunus persica]